MAASSSHRSSGRRRRYQAPTVEVFTRLTPVGIKAGIGTSFALSPLANKAGLRSKCRFDWAHRGRLKEHGHAKDNRGDSSRRLLNIRACGSGLLPWIHSVCISRINVKWNVENSRFHRGFFEEGISSVEFIMFRVIIAKYTPSNIIKANSDR